jgi:hypothetical protein
MSFPDAHRRFRRSRRPNRPLTGDADLARPMAMASFAPAIRRLRN